MKSLILLPPALLALTLATQCASARKDGAPTRRPSRVIDAHTHTNFTGKAERTSKIPITREQYVKELRDAGVVGSVSHTGRGGEGYVDLSSENVVSCYGAGPKINAAELEAGLKSAKFRCIKIYLGYVHQYAYDRAYEPAYKLAEKYDVPVVFHTGDTYDVKGKLKFADPLTIDEVAVDHPNVRFVIAHLGNPWIQSAAEVVYKNPNVYADLSALLIGDLTELSPEDLEEYVVKPVRWAYGYVEDPGKLMFGTDWPLTQVEPYIAAIAKAIPEEHWDEVFYGNAAKVFKFQK